ncbi:helix-turn-helix domain-containing protein [Halorubrum sp. DTA98]|uniref:helix-turn-helix domain-containing protein n=1 Tax=Halorubrum sp. DTA98 TaxID=3402163 RepID=UPI003AAE87C1
MVDRGTATPDETAAAESPTSRDTGPTPERETDGKAASASDRSPYEDRGVRAVLQVERGGSCLLDEFDGNVLDVDVRYQMGQCLAEVEVLEYGATTSSTKQFSAPICEHCPGIVFSRYGCIPRFLETGTGSFVVETRLDTVDTLSTLVNEVRQRCASVTVRSLTSTEGPDGTESCSVDISSLTPKQREAVSKAQDCGHYDPDSDTSLADVAAEIDISTSALSQRLQRAEANILRQLDCECSCWMDS